MKNSGESLRSTLGTLIAPAYIPVFFFAFSLSAITPVFPSYLAGLGAGVAAIGAVVSMRGLGQVFSDLPGGFLLAHWGIRPVVMASYIISIVSNVTLYFLRDISVIAAVVFVSGFSTSILITAIMARVRTTVPAGMRGRALSGVGGALRVGMLFGPFIGGVLAERLGVPVIFLVRAAAFTAGLTSYLIGETEGGAHVARASTPAATVGSAPFAFHDTVNRLRAGLAGRWYAIATVGFAILVLSILRSAREVIIPLWGEQLDLAPAQIGLAMSIGAAFDLLLFVPSGIISDRFGRKTAVTVCLVGFSAGLLLILPARGVILYAMAAALVGIGNGFGAGINMTTGTDLAPSGAVAEFLGLWRLYGDLGAAAGPAIVGSITAVLALGPAVGITAAIGLLGALVMATIAPETRDISA